MIVAFAPSIACLGQRDCVMGAGCFIVVKVLCYSSDRLKTAGGCNSTTEVAYHKTVGNSATHASAVEK